MPCKRFGCGSNNIAGGICIDCGEPQHPQSQARRSSLALPGTSYAGPPGGPAIYSAATAMPFPYSPGPMSAAMAASSASSSSFATGVVCSAAASASPYPNMAGNPPQDYRQQLIQHIQASQQVFPDALATLIADYANDTVIPVVKCVGQYEEYVCLQCAKANGPFIQLKNCPHPKSTGHVINGPISPAPYWVKCYIKDLRDFSYMHSRGPFNCEHPNWGHVEYLMPRFNQITCPTCRNINTIYINFDAEENFFDETAWWNENVEYRAQNFFSNHKLLMANPHANNNLIGKDGFNLLHYALRYYNTAALRKLLKNGADPLITTRDGISTLRMIFLPCGVSEIKWDNNFRKKLAPIMLFELLKKSPRLVMQKDQWGRGVFDYILERFTLEGLNQHLIIMLALLQAFGAKPEPRHQAEFQKRRPEVKRVASKSNIAWCNLKTASNLFAVPDDEKEDFLADNFLPTMFRGLQNRFSPDFVPVTDPDLPCICNQNCKEGNCALCLTKLCLQDRGRNITPPDHNGLKPPYMPYETEHRKYTYNHIKPDKDLKVCADCATYFEIMHFIRHQLRLPMPRDNPAAGTGDCVIC